MKNNFIAITGGIGSGKSCALSFIKELGFNTLSCDQTTNTIYQQQSTLKKLKKYFPNAIYGDTTLSLDKSILASEVFSDAKKYNVLSKIITKKVYKETLKQAKQLKGTVFIEIPLLFEFGYQKHYKKVILIVRDINDRIKSVISRSNLSKQQVLERIHNQFDYSTIDQSKYIVIHNDNTKEDLKEQLSSVIKTLI